MNCCPSEMETDASHAVRHCGWARHSQSRSGWRRTGVMEPFSCVRVGLG